MRNLTMCDIRLHASTVADSFEKAMVEDVLPHAGDELQHPESLFVRSLYAAADEAFPPAYRCIVDSTWVTDRGFFRMRDKARELGADADEIQFRLLAGSLPDDEQALEVLRSGRARGLVMLAIHLPFGKGEPAFEEELLAALKDEVGVATRVNNVYAAFWTRDDSIVPGNTEYLVAAIGDFMQPQLRKDTLAQIEAAGGDVAESRPTVSSPRSPGPTRLRSRTSPRVPASARAATDPPARAGTPDGCRLRG